MINYFHSNVLKKLENSVCNQFKLNNDYFLTCGCNAGFWQHSDTVRDNYIDNYQSHSEKWTDMFTADDGPTGIF